MLYKVINSDLYLNGKVAPEGSEIELSEEQTVGITAYLQPLEVKPIINKTIKQLNNKKEKIK